MTDKKADVRKLGRGGRMSVKRKRNAVVRLLRGEDLETVSRELAVTAATLASWREAFLNAGESALKSRSGDGRDEQIRRLEGKVGQTLMDNELLREKIIRLEAGVPLGRRRPRR